MIDRMLFQTRIAQLEATLGLTEISSENATVVEDRLEALENSLKERFDGHDEILLMLDDLSPKTALTYNASVGIAPLLYRQQEILASANDYRAVLQQLQQASQLIINDNSKADLTSSSLFESIDEYPSGLDKLEESLENIQQRTKRLAARLDHLLDHYESTMMALSEQLLLWQENEFVGQSFDQII